MKILRAWIEAMRLRTLPVSAAGVLTAIALNLRHHNLHLTPAILCLIFALLAQIASNFANEYFDYRAGRDRAGREGPRRGVTEGDLTPRAMLAATLLTLAAACAIGLTVMAYAGWWLVPVGVAVALGVFAYSAGPYPLSTHGLGEVAVILFFGLVPVGLTYYISAGSCPAEVWRAAVAVGLMGANVLIVNNYRDVDDDRAVNKLTLAVRFGRPAMRLLYAANGLAAMALMLPTWLAINPYCTAIPAAVAAASVAIALRMAHLQGARLTPLLAATSLLMFAHALLLLLSPN
ncbi:MAG: 1,4-dihydroxy-2-naphthoate octaprenyltransferase [Muribaculaceae bacterium]